MVRHIEVAVRISEFRSLSKQMETFLPIAKMCQIESRQDSKNLSNRETARTGGAHTTHTVLAVIDTNRRPFNGAVTGEVGTCQGSWIVWGIAYRVYHCTTDVTVIERVNALFGELTQSLSKVGVTQ